MSCHAPVVIITAVTGKSKHLFYVMFEYTITHVLDIHGCRMSIYLSGSFVEMCVKWRAAADDVFSVVWKMGFCVGEGRGGGRGGDTGRGGGTI